MNSRKSFWILCAIAFLLCATTNLPWQLDDYDQAKQAYTSFEMVKEGHWLYQHTPHERIATKPPLVGWSSAALYFVTRSWAVAWRLPSIAAAVALAILLFRAGAVYGPTGSLVASSAFAFNLLTPRLSTLVRTDMPLALAISAIGFLIWNKVRTYATWTRRERWLLFALLTAAMLIKGPIVYAFLLPGLIVIHFLGGRHAASPARTRLDTGGWWPWIASLAIFLLWAIGGSVFVPGFYDQVVSREFLGRFGETVHRPQPLLFYFPHLLHKFFPWSVLLIALAITNWRAGKLDRLKQSSSAALFWNGISPETWWLIGWSIGGLIVMSIIPSKRVDRIFPVIPPFCLLLAAQIGNISPNERLNRRVVRWSAVTLLVAILFTGGYSGFKIFTGYREKRDALAAFGQKVQKVGGGLKYEVLESKDEGLLLYLNKLHFVSRPSAIAEWNRGHIDALVAPEQKAPDLIQELQSAQIHPLKSKTIADKPINYVLITHAE